MSEKDRNKVHQLHPQHRKIELLPEEQKPLLNVVLAEVVLGYQRRLNESTGQFEWCAPPGFSSSDLPWVGIDHLPNFAENELLAMDLFKRMAMDHRLIPSLIIDNEAGPEAREQPVKVAIAERYGRNRDSIRRHALARGSNVCMAICWAVVATYKPNIEQYHRDLFPGRYLAS